MNSNIVMIIALFAVMISMTGMASAFNLNIAGGTNPMQLGPGQSIILDLEGNQFSSSDVNAGKIFNLTAEVTCITSGCNPGDITVTFIPSSTFGPVINPSFKKPGALKIAVSPSSPGGANYKVLVQAGLDGIAEIGVDTRSTTSIPEFPAVALPVGAAIGLLFFFQQKKRKK